jgi:hypothetical protein
MTTTETDATTDHAGPDASATLADENPGAATEIPEDRENGSQVENEGEGGDSENRGRSGRLRERAQAAEARVAEVEQQNADYVDTIAKLQKFHLEQAITAAGVKPAAVWAVADYTDLLDDNGLPDAEKVTVAVENAREQLGIRPQPQAVHRQRELRSGAGTSPPKRDGWVSAFARRDE